MPITMTESPAAPNLIKIICCSSKTECKTMTCSYCKHGVKCTDSCKECCGVSCINWQEVDLDMFDEHDKFFLLFLFVAVDLFLPNRFVIFKK